LAVPAPELVLGPEPTVNKWGVLAVGLPIWLWAKDPGAIDASVSEDGIDIALNASMGDVTVDWGDGMTSVCESMTPRPAGGEPMVHSPDCGHVYLHKGDYTITASASWQVTWAALDHSGEFTLAASGAREVPIREFVAVVTG
jgi:hypothetical protein